MRPSLAGRSYLRLTRGLVVRAFSRSQAPVVRFLRTARDRPAVIGTKTVGEMITRLRAGRHWTCSYADRLGRNWSPIDSRVSKELASWGLPSSIENECPRDDL